VTEHPTPTPTGLLGTATVIRGNARHLPLPDNSVDLVVTSPPYFALRSYQDGCSTCHGSPDSYRVKTCSSCGETTGRMKCHNGCDAPMRYTPQDPAPDPVCPDCNGTGKGHYAGQIGDEPTPTEFIDALIEVTAECMRVLKPTGSLWVNLGDKYAGSSIDNRERPPGPTLNNPRNSSMRAGGVVRPPKTDVRSKSLIGIPWRYALRCIDDLGLILRAEIILDKKNGLPESVTDRVRRSHEQVFHFVKEPRYFSAVDEIRVPTEARKGAMTWAERRAAGEPGRRGEQSANDATVNGMAGNPLGALPGSVWPYTSEPFQPPAHLGVDHFAAFASALPRRIILGWSPLGVCTGCGQGRRPLVRKDLTAVRTVQANNAPRQDVHRYKRHEANGHNSDHWQPMTTTATISSYACDCAEPTAATTPAVILDPFGGTGTTALVAKALGRHGITVDMSADYGRLAKWRVNDLDQLAKVQGIRRSDAARAADGLDMDTLFDFDGGAA
jgi:DNA modification methylase